MKQKDFYEQPRIQVVRLQVTGQLLAGSDNEANARSKYLGDDGDGFTQDY